MMAAEIKAAQSTQETLMENQLPGTGYQVKGTCLQHQDRCAEFFCGPHDQLFCDICKSSHHGKCVDVKSVKEMSINITGSKEFKNFNYRLTTLKSKTEEILRDAREKLKLVNGNHDDIVDAVKEMRKELNDALDKLEEGMLQKAKMNKEIEAVKVRAISDQFEPAQKEILELMEQMERMQEKNQTDAMFILMKEAENKLKSAETMLAGVNDDIKVKGYMLQPNTSLQEALRKPDAMGKFFPNIWTEHENNINIKTAKDTCRCWVTSITALSNKLIATDRGNSKIKVIDTNQLTVTSELSLQSRPWAVTKINDQKVAITVPYIKKIMIVKLASLPIIEKEIGTSDKCHGIAHWDGRFIVTFNKKDKIEIIDITGTVVHTIATDIMKQKLFSCPEYVTLSSNNQMAYVSNYLSNSVVCIGLAGTIKGMYKDRELVQPRHIQVDQNEIIFICGCGSQNIHLVSKDLKKIKVLPTCLGKLYNPRTICLSQEGDKLFIDRCPDYISVFKVSSFLNIWTPKLIRG